MAVADIIVAANAGVPTNALKPNNCHEAALGWVLMAKYPTLRNVDPLSQGVPKAWMSLRSLSQRYGTNVPKQLTGMWMAQKIYANGYTKITPPIAANAFSDGDLIFMGNRTAPHHSMVIVDTTNGQALARGFNNAGAFGGPFMGWDATLRDLKDAQRWDAAGNFMGNNGPCELYVISYDTVCNAIPDSLNF